MEDTDDFTFCQVSAPDGNYFKEQPSSVLDVKNLSLHDVSVKMSDSAFHCDTSSSNLMQKDSGSSSSNDIKKTPKLTHNQDKSASENMARKAQVSSIGALEQNPTTRKPTARAKVPFQIGYSQMDWLKLTRSEPDLAGLKGKSNRRLISIDEVRLHKTEDSVWTVLKGCVYNISPYMKFHPGGVDMLMKAAGKDCTSLFNKYHPWVNAEFMLEKCLVGVLDDSS